MCSTYYLSIGFYVLLSATITIRYLPLSVKVSRRAGTLPKTSSIYRPILHLKNEAVMGGDANVLPGHVHEPSLIFNSTQ